MQPNISSRRRLLPALLASAALAAVLLHAYHERMPDAAVADANALLTQSSRRRLGSSSKDYYSGSKQSLSELTSSNPAGFIAATIMILILGSLAAGAGIGGGGLFVPFYMILLDVSLNSAVPLSKATILGGAIGNFVTISRARHPKAERPLIDYEASTLMQSGELLGVVFGARSPRRRVTAKPSAFALYTQH